ncbi:MAG: insulinase family protein [Treponema sp.]|jgi:zinc protease|nr:insulinase family protein [Treponema sp.]
MKQQIFRKTNLKLFKLLAVFAALTAVISCAGAARTTALGNLGQPSDPVPFMEGAITGTLPSGMRYFLLENSMPEGRAFLTLAVDAGSILETEEERGLAHFVEHMAFRGTTRFPDNEVINYLRSLGMRFGPEINAHVSFDETVYRIEVPVETGEDGRRRIPDRALELIDDWSHAVSFYPEAVESERLVVIEEYRFRMGARERLNRQVFPVLFRDSLYSERMPIGLLSVIENATPEQLRAFYEKWYRPENMALVIVGDFDAAYLQARLAGHFPARAEAAAEPFNRPRHDLRQPSRGSLQTLVLTDPEIGQTRVDIYWKRSPQRRARDLAAFRELLVDNLIGTMISLRFEESAANPLAPYVFAGGGTINFAYSSRFYMLTAQAKTGRAQDTLQALLTAHRTITRFGFSEDEKEIASVLLLSHLRRAVAENDRQNSNTFVRTFTRYFLNGRMATSAAWELDAVQHLLPGITIREINRAVRNYFAENDMTVVITAPEAELASLPADSEITAMVAATRRAQVARPQINRVRGELLALAPQPGSIVAESVDEETGAIRLILSNGAEVILKETANRNNEVSFFAQARGGVLSVPEEMSVSAELAAEMLNASGLGPHSRTELISMLADRQVMMSFWAQNFLRGFQGLSSTDDLQTLFEMLYISFTQPRFDEDAVAAAMDQRRSQMAFVENDPNAFFSREITRNTHGNARFHPLELEDLERFNIDHAYAFVRGGLNPADFTFVFVGNIDFTTIRFLAETFIASIPAAEPFSEWAVMDRQRPQNMVQDIYLGMEERSIVYAGWFTPHPLLQWDAGWEAAASAVSVLNAYLDIRLIDEIREVLGGVYTISAWVGLSPFSGGELSGGLFFVTDPERVEELLSAAKEEFREIGRGNIDLGVFNNAVQAQLRGHEQAIQSNAHIAQSFANSAVIFRSPLSRLTERPEMLDAVTPADIVRIMSELLEGNFAQMVLFPDVSLAPAGIAGAE